MKESIMNNLRTKFKHIRNVNCNGQILAQGGMTVAYIIDDDKNVLGFATAKCRIPDAFSKHIGRVKSEGRLKSPRYYIDLQKPVPEKEFLNAIINLFNQFEKEHNHV